MGRRIPVDVLLRHADRGKAARAERLMVRAGGLRLDGACIHRGRTRLVFREQRGRRALDLERPIVIVVPSHLTMVCAATIRVPLWTSRVAKALLPFSPSPS